MIRFALAASIASALLWVTAASADPILVAVVPYSGPIGADEPSVKAVPYVPPTGVAAPVAPAAIVGGNAPTALIAPANGAGVAASVGSDIDRSWEVRQSDGTFQNLISRWAAEAGWTAKWVVPEDIPLTASAMFTGSFKDAVRGALASTELTDYPVHACFYTNNFVRVVLYSVSCHKE